jgi:DeoR/GlpR family transcriptional regulator of sugar metabolism
MLSAERQQAISQLVAQQGAVNVAELARQFQVSGSTIRRDLEQLEIRGLIHRTHGGAVAPGAASATRLSAELGIGRIGRAAACRVHPGETVYLGPGRLTLETAKALSSRNRVTVVTNSLEIAHWLANNTLLTVILTGGTVGRPRNGLTGPLADQALRSLRADRVIIEAAGISPDQGLMGADLAQAEIGRQLISTPAETIILVPPERVGRVGGILVSPASEVDVVITVREAPDAALWDLSQLGIAIIKV